MPHVIHLIDTYICPCAGRRKQAGNRPLISRLMESVTDSPDESVMGDDRPVESAIGENRLDESLVGSRPASTPINRPVVKEEDACLSEAVPPIPFEPSSHSTPKYPFTSPTPQVAPSVGVHLCVLPSIAL